MKQERKRLVILLVGSLVLLAVLWVFALLPALREHGELLEELAAMDGGLKTFQEKDVATLFSEVRAEHQALKQEWESLRSAAMTFEEGSPLGEVSPTNEEGRIRFRVAHKEAREQLSARAVEAGTALPYKLGVEETIEEEENPEMRLWQLASMVQLMNTCMDVRVPSITEAKALPPRILYTREEGPSALVEYPIRIRMQGSFETAILFLESLREEGRFFTLRNFQMESRGLDAIDDLELLAVCSAVLPETVLRPSRGLRGAVPEDAGRNRSERRLPEAGPRPRAEGAL
jgi:Tfp pilus assembly protein PilO